MGSGGSWKDLFGEEGEALGELAEAVGLGAEEGVALGEVLAGIFVGVGGNGMGKLGPDVVHPLIAIGLGEDAEEDEVPNLVVEDVEEGGAVGEAEEDDDGEFLVVIEESVGGDGGGILADVGKGGGDGTEGVVADHIDPADVGFGEGEDGVADLLSGDD